LAKPTNLPEANREHRSHKGIAFVQRGRVVYVIESYDEQL
jgi:hypothetical protein